MACRSHQRFAASVHSPARRYSASSWQVLIMLQYTMPVTFGRSSPLTAATVASSRRAIPSSASPRATSDIPW
jgi:hypothetical protein